MLLLEKNCYFDWKTMYIFLLLNIAFSKVCTLYSQWCIGLYIEAYIRYIAVDPRKTSKL
jgi:hypothetical protein